MRSAGVVSTEALASELDVSSETIRRDLLVLEEQGVLQKVHGGATIAGSSVAVSEPPFDVRSEEELQRKQRIASLAAGLIPSGSLAFIDVGTTALLAAKALPHALAATIVTASLRIAVELSDRPGLDVLVTGGRLRKGELALSGMLATATLAEMHFDVALLGSGGLHSEAGLTDYYYDEAQARRAIIARSARSYILCDGTKFEKIAQYRVAGLADFTGVVVDEAPDEPLAKALQQSGAQIISSS